MQNLTFCEMSQKRKLCLDDVTVVSCTHYNILPNTSPFASQVFYHL